MGQKKQKVKNQEVCNDFCIIGKKYEDGSMKYIHFKYLSFIALPEKEGAHQVKCSEVEKFMNCLRGFKNQGFVGIKIDETN